MNVPQYGIAYLRFKIEVQHYGRLPIEALLFNTKDCQQLDDYFECPDSKYDNRSILSSKLQVRYQPLSPV